MAPERVAGIWMLVEAVPGSEKTILMSTSLGTDLARWADLGMRWMKSMVSSMGWISGRMADIRVRAKFWSWFCATDSGIPCNFMLLHRDLSSRSTSLALIQLCSSLVSSYTSTRSFMVSVHPPV